jgi:hypothetical protein
MTEKLKVIRGNREEIRRIERLKILSKGNTNRERRPTFYIFGTKIRERGGLSENPEFSQEEKPITRKKNEIHKGIK